MSARRLFRRFPPVGMLPLSSFQLLVFSHLCPGQGFAEMMEHRTTIKLSTGDLDASEVESFCAEEQPSPQVRRCVSFSATIDHIKHLMTSSVYKTHRVYAPYTVTFPAP